MNAAPNPMMNMPMRGGMMGGNMMRGGMGGMMGGMPNNNFGGGAAMGFARGGGMIPQGPRGGMMGGGFGGRGGGMMGNMGMMIICLYAALYTIVETSLTGMGMIPTGPMGARGGFGAPVQGHFNPAFMQAQSGGAQFGPDGPRKRYRMEQSG